MTASPGVLIAALDVGTAKVCCFIAEDDGEGVPQALGVGHKVSYGLRNGTVVDIEAAGEAIRAAVHAAERMAGETIRSVVVNLSSGWPVSQRFTVEVEIGGHEVGEADLRRVRELGYRVPAPEDRTVVHALPVAYSIDGVGGIRDPRGLFGDALGVAMHVVTAGSGAVRNLSACVARCHLDIDDLVLSAYAAGRAVLVEDERELGAICIDMGAGTTSIAVFQHGRLVFADSVPVGGGHVTNDLARGLVTPLADAERLKTLYGSAIVDAADDRDLIDVPEIGERGDAGPNHVPRARLVEIIRPRIEETFELVRDRLRAAGVGELAGRRVALSGGASQLSGVREVAAQILDRHVRLGRPRALRGLAESTSGPAFAACAGLLAHAIDRDPVAVGHRRGTTREPSASFGRIGQWLRDNF